ncbi:MAG: tRNA (adenosine(37)-N6)-dimethylallyltransferase MiaA, partial [Clostridia bacterium]|nr:tRNA (adenosine(37)-N6)-dimethylallyltransferase MiaA [Clostridia bacterium]
CQNRDFLYDRIDRRVDEMIQKGLVKEAERYYSNDYSSTSSQAIGYKEIKPFLDGESSLSQCIDNLKKATRHYAKRQLTWFRRNSDSLVFYIDNYSSLDELTKDVLNTIRRE